jgi:hypothetical protein
VGPLVDLPELRDRRGRRFPAHLDPEYVRDYLDWWRSAYRKQHPPLPRFTYTTRRWARDADRARAKERFAERGQPPQRRDSA